MVVDEAKVGDLVLIDPFDPKAVSPKNGLTAAGAADRLVERGACVLFWRALNAASPSSPVHNFDLCIQLQFKERTGSMDGCDLILGNVSSDLVADVGRLAVAHGTVLTNGRVTVEVGSGPRQRAPVAVPAIEPM